MKFVLIFTTHCSRVEEIGEETVMTNEEEDSDEK